MKLTPSLRKEINAAVRANVNGASPSARVGIRGDHHGVNALRWTAEDDLWDAWPLAGVREIDDDPDNSGFALLDLYVDTGRGPARELETNVYVYIHDSHVIGATSDSLGTEALRAKLNFPKGKGW